jgi:hypothetical protein
MNGFIPAHPLTTRFAEQRIRNVTSFVAVVVVMLHRTHVESGTPGFDARMDFGITPAFNQGVTTVVMLSEQFDSVWKSTSSFVGDVCIAIVIVPAFKVTARTSTQKAMSWNELNPIQSDSFWRMVVATLSFTESQS